MPSSKLDTLDVGPQGIMIQGRIENTKDNKGEKLNKIRLTDRGLTFSLDRSFKASAKGCITP